MFGIMRAMKDKADAANYSNGWQRCGCIAFDAMSMKGGVWFQYHTGRVLGFPCNDGMYDAVINEFKNRAESLKNDEKVRLLPIALLFYLWFRRSMRRRSPSIT